MANFKHKIFIAALIFMAIMSTLYGTVYFISKFYLNADTVKQVVTARVNEKLHRNLTINDRFDISIGLDFEPHVIMDKITLSNIKGSSHPNMLEVDTVELSIDLFALLFKDIKITGLRLNNPTIYLETVNGINNWDFDLADGVDPNDPGSKINIKDIEVKDGTVIYTKDNAKVDTLIIDTFNLESNSDNTYFEGTLKGMLNDKSIYLDADVAKHTLEFKLDVNKLIYGNNDFTGKLTIIKDTKEVAGEFKSKVLALDTLSSKNSNSSGEYQVPDDNIDVAFLNGSNIKIIYKIGKLSYGKLLLNDIELDIVSKNNAINIAFNPALKLAGGKVNLNISYDLKSASPTLAIDFKATDMSFETLLVGIMGKSSITGSTLQITSNLQSNGANYRTLVNNLNGKFLATASSGNYINSSASIENLFADVLTAMITVNKKEATTGFTCGVMNFKVNNGVAQAPNGIGVEAASVNVLGNGTVDLRNGRINFTITPKNVPALSSIDITQFSMAQAISISGTISKPQVNFNPMGLINSTNVAAATSIATKLISFPIAIASIAKDELDKQNAPASISPCKVALGN